MDGAHFGAFLADVRRECGFTQAELAERLNVTDKAVSKWERGRGLPDIQLLEPIAEALGVSVEELVRCRHAPREEQSGGIVNWRRVGPIVERAAWLASFAAMLFLPLLWGGRLFVAGRRELGYSMVSAGCLVWLGVLACRRLRRVPAETLKPGSKGTWTVYAVVFLLTVLLEVMIAAVTVRILSISYVPSRWINGVVIPAIQLLLAMLYGVCLWKARKAPHYYPAAVQALGGCLAVCGIVQVLHGTDIWDDGSSFLRQAVTRLILFSVPAYLCGLLVSGVLLLVLIRKRKRSPSAV